MIHAKSMTTGAPWKHILRFALPVLAGMLLQQLYNTVDAVIVGNFSGEAALSAVGTTGSFIFLFLALAIGFSTGNGVLVAQCYGAKNEPQMRANASVGIVLLLGLGVAATAAAWLLARPAFTHWVGVPPELMEQTLCYFRLYALGLIFQFGYNIFSSILRAVGDSAATLYFLLVASVINVALDLLFVAVFHWGVAGAAWATNLAQLASCAAAYGYMCRKYPIFRFSPRQLTWDKQLAKNTFSVGFPIALQLTIVSFGLTFIQRAVNSFGAAMTASFTVAYRMELYLGLPCNAFQTTLATYTGQNMGAGKRKRIQLGVRQTVLMSFLMTLAISIALWAFAGPIISLFKLSPAAAQYCLPHLHTIAWVTLILATYIPLFGVFQGSGHSGAAAIVAVGALGLRVLSTYLLKGEDLWGPGIIWWNGLFGFVAGFCITWSYYLSNRWQKNPLISRQKAKL